jgi:phosphoglycolate phosphatase-like HAD superfamily hydrolase
MIKLVAFDWNGTLLADSNAMIKAENVVLKQYALPPTNLEEFQAVFTIPIRKYWLAKGFDPDIFDRDAKKIEDLYMSAYEPLENVCRSRSGAREILDWLKKNGTKTAIYSNHYVPHIHKQLKRLKLDGFVEDIFGRSIGDYSHMHNRSKEAKLAEYVRKIRVRPREVLTVGDTVEEVEIAKNSGYYSVAITGGSNSLIRLKAVNPNFLITNLAELKDIIKELNS